MKRKKIFIWGLVFIIIAYTFMPSAESAAADYEIAGGGGISAGSPQSTQGILIGAWIKRLNTLLELRIEPNLEFIEARSGTSMFIGGVSPILRLGTHGQSLNPFLDGGVGASISSKKTLGDWNLGGNFFFSPTVGAGVKFGSSESGVSIFARFVHHSNADLFPPNQSLNLLYFLLGYRF